MVSAPFGLDAAQVRDTAIPIEFEDERGDATGRRFYMLHPVLSMESRVHNVVGLAGAYDNEAALRQLRASIVCAHEFGRDVLEGRFEADDPERTVRKLNERIYRFCTRDPHAKELYRAKGIDPARAPVDHPRFDRTFREVRLPQMREGLARRAIGIALGGTAPALPPTHLGGGGGRRGPQR